MVKPIINHNKVSKKQWNKWSRKGQTTFNLVYGIMLENQWAFLHPKAKPAKDIHWKTTAWNAAWIAADAVSGTLDS